MEKLTKLWDNYQRAKLLRTTKESAQSQLVRAWEDEGFDSTRIQAHLARALESYIAMEKTALHSFTKAFEEASLWEK